MKKVFIYTCATLFMFCLCQSVAFADWKTMADDQKALSLNATTGKKPAALAKKADADTAATNMSQTKSVASSWKTQVELLGDLVPAEELSNGLVKWTNSCANENAANNQYNEGEGTMAAGNTEITEGNTDYAAGGADPNSQQYHDAYDHYCEAYTQYSASWADYSQAEIKYGTAETSFSDTADFYQNLYWEYGGP